MYEQSTETQSSNGKAVGASVLAAGAAGLAGAIMMSRQSRQERAQERVRQRLAQIEAGANDAISQLNRALDGLSFDRAGTTRSARKKSRKLSKSAAAAADDALKRARKRVAEIDKEVRKVKVAENANRMATDGSERAAALSAALSERIGTVLEEVRHGATDLGDKASSRASAVASATSAQAERARDMAQPVKVETSRLAQDVKARGAELAAQGAALVADVRHRSPELLEKAKGVAHDATDHARDLSPDVRERLSEVATKASERGGDVVARARERAPELAERVRERAPEVLGNLSSTLTSTTHDLQEQAKPLLAEAGTVAARAAEQARSVARDAGKTILPEVQHQAGAIGERVSTTTHAIEQSSRRAASAAGQGTKDATALMVWSAAAAGVAYIAFLNEEQRQKVRESGKRIWAEVRTVYQDIRGYDQDFS